jgi:hypothetical protein
MFVFLQALMAGPNTHDETFIHLQGLTSARPGRPGFLSFAAAYLERAGSRLRAEVTLPAGVSGEFSWRGVQRTPAPGANVLTIDGASK